MGKISSKGNRISSNEKGATMLEAAIITPVVLPMVFLILYFNILAYRMANIHYYIQNELRAVSTGPDVPTSLSQGRFGNFTKNVMLKVKSTLNKTGNGVPNGTILFRNGTTCHTYIEANLIKVTDSHALNFASLPPERKLDFSTCPPSYGAPNPVQGNYGVLTPNDFVSVEVLIDVLPQNIPIFGRILPTPKIMTGMKTGNFSGIVLYQSPGPQFQ